MSTDKNAILMPFTEQVLMGLIDACTGILLERPYVNKKGERGVRTYERAPDVKAIDLFLKMTGQHDLAEAQKRLAEAQVRSIEDLITARVNLIRARNLESQTDLNEITTKAYTAELITVEDFENTVKGLGALFISLMTSLPLLQMQEACSSEEAYERHKMRLKTAMMKGVTSALNDPDYNPSSVRIIDNGVREVPNAIALLEAADEEEDYEEDDEEEMED